MHDNDQDPKPPAIYGILTLGLMSPEEREAALRETRDGLRDDNEMLRKQIAEAIEEREALCKTTYEVFELGDFSFAPGYRLH
jgi:hypothetical protein